MKFTIYDLRFTRPKASGRGMRIGGLRFGMPFQGEHNFSSGSEGVALGYYGNALSARQTRRIAYTAQSGWTFRSKDSPSPRPSPQGEGELSADGLTVHREAGYSTFRGGRGANRPYSAIRPFQRFNISTFQLASQRAFTLIEMLTVIAIIGIIASLAVPVIKNFGQADVTVSASRQMLDDIGHARQLAMADRTTVYMVFVPTNFWDLGGSLNSTWYTKLTAPQLTVFSNLLDKQLTSYTYIAYGALGDQPGRHTWHYLAPWQSLPEGTFIPLWKFVNPGIKAPGYTFYDPANANYSFSINPFSTNNTFPFPTEDSTNSLYATSLPNLPYIAFNYLGQLCDYSGQMLSSQDIALGQDYDQDFVGGGVDIPLAQGSVISGKDPATRAPIMGPPGVTEMPPGNSTNIAYSVVHIDPLTGRATLEYHKMQ